MFWKSLTISGIAVDGITSRVGHSPHLGTIAAVDTDYPAAIHFDQSRPGKDAGNTIDKYLIGWRGIRGELYLRSPTLCLLSFSIISHVLIAPLHGFELSSRTGSAPIAVY
jgi:hypothetical protein